MFCVGILNDRNQLGNMKYPKIFPPPAAETMEESQFSIWSDRNQLENIKYSQKFSASGGGNIISADIRAFIPPLVYRMVENNGGGKGAPILEILQI